MPSQAPITALTDSLKRAAAKFEPEAKKDLLAALDAFPDLMPSTANHIFPDGINRLCCSLGGTIPVTYKGLTYHIPVTLYLLDNHPYTGPYCYVRPTTLMRIKTSNSVDDKGRIYLPYLTEWRYPQHDTVGLLQVMAFSFQEKCPVFSVSSSSTTTAATSGGGGAVASSPNPPYPAMPAPNAGGGIGTGYGYQPPYPLHQQAATPAPTSTPYPTGGGGHPSMPMPMPHSTTTGGRSPYGSRTSLNNPAASSTPPAGTPSGGYYPASGIGTSTIQASHIKASLLSAVSDQIRLQLMDKIGTPFAELQSINANLQELRANGHKLRESSERMQAEKRQLDSVRAIYQEKKSELERALHASSATNGGQEMGVEEAVDAPTPLHRQIVANYVADCAVDDTIYHLGQALKRGTINLPVYLKYVRQLSRQQFINRATMQKCRLRAQLPV